MPGKMMGEPMTALDFLNLPDAPAEPTPCPICGQTYCDTVCPEIARLYQELDAC